VPSLIESTSRIPKSRMLIANTDLRTVAIKLLGTETAVVTVTVTVIVPAVVAALAVTGPGLDRRPNVGLTMTVAGETGTRTGPAMTVTEMTMAAMT
jgi:hypothetical protein